MRFESQYYQLRNGVRVLLVPMPGVESVTALALVKTGSRNEQDTELGISHVLEHMLFKGTGKYPTPLSLATAVDSLGAASNAFTGKEYTGYYITSAAKHLKQALEILGSMLTTPLIPASDLEREKGVIIEEINMYEDHPMERAGEEFENLIYGGSKMGRLIIGSKETVRGVKRENLIEYWRKWYRGENVLVVVAGKTDQPREAIVEAFGSLVPGERQPYLEETQYGAARQKHIDKKTEQAHFVLGVPGVSMRDPRRYALAVGQTVLGGNMSSRLFTEIREKRGLAYYVRAELETNFDAGYLSVKAGVKLEKLEEAMEVARREMLKLSESLNGSEILRAKEYLRGKLALQLEGTGEVAQFVGVRALVLGEVHQPQEVAEKIAKVELGEVRGVLAELVREEAMRTCVVGPSLGE